MAPHSSTLAWKIPWMEEPGRLQSWDLEESDTTEQLHFHFSLSCIGEGNGNPLQCSCLENPRDEGAWWAAVYGVAQSRTRLKRLSAAAAAAAVCKCHFKLSHAPWLLQTCKSSVLFQLKEKKQVVQHFLNILRRILYVKYVYIYVHAHNVQLKTILTVTFKLALSFSKIVFPTQK